VIQHTFKGGMDAGQNNALWAGRDIVTGHLHRLRAVSLNYYNFVHWGMEAGTMADYDCRHFLNYTQDNPLNWQQGFLILHFSGGKFDSPETVLCHPDGRVPFRGDLLDV